MLHGFHVQPAFTNRPQSFHEGALQGRKGGIQFQFRIPFQRFHRQAGLFAAHLLLLFATTAHPLPHKKAIDDHKRHESGIKHQYCQGGIDQ